MTNNFTPAKAGQQSKRLSKEEYAEKMKAEKEAVYQMADDTAKAIVSDPEKFKAFLDTQSRLDRYSAVNALLIFKQLPEASQLKNFDDWSKDNVKIQKGAKSISILEPVEYAKKDGTTGISYNVKKVFDVSQTNGKRPPAPTVNRDPKALITVMLDSSPVEVEATNELPYPNSGGKRSYCRYRCRRLGCGGSNYCAMSCSLDCRFCVRYLLFGRGFRHGNVNADSRSGNQSGI